MAKKKPDRPPPFRDRIVDLRRVRAADLLPSEFNWRVHPDGQRAAVTGSLKELGITEPLKAWQLPDGRLKLWDGHLREDIFLGCGPDTLVPVVVTDLTEAEAKKANLTHDPLAAMADADAEKLEELLADVQTDDEALRSMLDDLAGEHGGRGGVRVAGTGRQPAALHDLDLDRRPDGPVRGGRGRRGTVSASFGHRVRDDGKP